MADRRPVARLPDISERARLRDRFGVTQTELAAELNVSRKTIYMWEHGITEPAGYNRLRYSELLDSWTRTERIESEAREATGQLSIP